MAVAVVKHGKNQRIREIAQKIIVDQQQEVVAMELAISEPASRDRRRDLHERMRANHLGRFGLSSSGRTVDVIVDFDPAGTKRRPAWRR
jgi:hypothetical protein